MHKEKTKSPAACDQLGFDKKFNAKDITSSAQRQRLLAYLRTNSINTIEARKKLNILSPAPRVHELRHDYQFNIVMNRVTEKDGEGNTHKVGRYTLLSGKWREGKARGGN